MKRFLLTFTSFVITLLANAQQNDSLTVKDYRHAESLMGYNTQQFVDHGSVNANWLDGDKFWYRTLTPQGSEFILVDATKGTRTAAFDQQKLATALSAAAGRIYTAPMLPFQSFIYSEDGRSIIFRA